MAVIFKDNSTLILRQLDNNAKRAIEQAKNRAVEMVQGKILYGYHDPHGADGHTEIVETGKLFDSIKAESKRVSSNAYSFEVGTDVPYAVFVHDGTYKLKGRPFIRDGLMDGADELKAIFGDNLKAGL